MEEMVNDPGVSEIGDHRIGNPNCYCGDCWPLLQKAKWRRNRVNGQSTCKFFLQPVIVKPDFPRIPQDQLALIAEAVKKFRMDIYWKNAPPEMTKLEEVRETSIFKYIKTRNEIAKLDLDELTISWTHTYPYYDPAEQKSDTIYIPFGTVITYEHPKYDDRVPVPPEIRSLIPANCLGHEEAVRKINNAMGLVDKALLWLGSRCKSPKQAVLAWPGCRAFMTMQMRQNTQDTGRKSKISYPPLPWKREELDDAAALVRIYAR